MAKLDRTLQRIGKSLLATTLLGFVAGPACGQLIFSETFESDGDGERYELFDPGFEFTGDSGPGMWGLNTDAEQIGLVQNAPAKRAAILWQHDAFADDFTTESLEVWQSLVAWATDDKENAKIGFFPGYESAEGTLVVAEHLEDAGYVLEEIFDAAELFPPPADLDVVIHSSELASTAFSELSLPLISFSGSDHDDTAIAGIGQSVSFIEEVAVEVPEAAEGHPALGGKTGTIPWAAEGVSLNTIGKLHNGGTALATIEYEDPNTGDEVEGAAVFVVEEGAPLLGAFNPDPEGDGYLVGAALNKFGDLGEKMIELGPIDVSGKDDLQLTVALAATAADFEAVDYLRIEADPDGDGPMPTETIQEFWGVTEAGDCLKGLSNGETAGEEGDICLPETEFNDYTFALPEGSTDLVIRFAALTTWGNEIIAIDNIRVSSGPPGPECDFDGDGQLGVGDIDLLLQAVRSGSNDANFDVDGSGSVDQADIVSLVEGADKLNTYIGDANLDGQFNSTDLVTTFTAGEYEDGIDGNSTWATGDWNGDGDYSSTDFVLAFSQGGYEAGPRAATAAVPEPSSWALILLGCLPLLRIRK